MQLPQFTLIPFPRGCFMTPGATFAPERVHFGSLSWLYICLHDTTTKCHAGASHPGVSSTRFLYRGENFTPVRNLATVSCKRETTTRFGVKSAYPISYIESSSLTAHAGLTRRATLESSIWGAIVIGFRKTMHITGSSLGPALQNGGKSNRKYAKEICGV